MLKMEPQAPIKGKFSRLLPVPLCLCLLCLILPFPRALSSEGRSLWSERRETLKQLIEEALKRSPLLKIHEEETKLYEAKAAMAGPLENPLLTLEAADRSPGRFFSGGGEHHRFTVGLEQKLPFPGKLALKRLEAKDRWVAQRELLQSQEKLVAKAVRTAYLGLYLRMKKLQLSGEQLKVLKQLIVISRTKYTFGKISQAEFMNFQLAEAMLQKDLMEQEKDIRWAIGEMNHLLGRADHQPMGRPAEIMKTPVDLGVLAAHGLAQKALDSSPQISSSKALLSASEHALESAHRESYPDFQLRVGYSPMEKDGLLKEGSALSIMVGVQLPLNFRERQGEEVREAQALKNKAALALEEERTQLTHNIINLIAELEEAQNKLTLYKDSLLPLSEQAVQSGIRAYVSGKLEHAALLGTIKVKFQNELAYDEALVLFESRLSELEAMGVRVPLLKNLTGLLQRHR